MHQTTEKCQMSKVVWIILSIATHIISWYNEIMTMRLRHYFVPHEDNAHQPHLLRTRTTMHLLGLVVLLEVLYLAAAYIIIPRSDYFAAVLSSILVEQTNAKRTEESLGALAINPKLVAAAQEKADDMATRGYFSHNTPDGRTPWWFIDDAGYVYAAAGENLAVNFTESSDVTDAWMRSPLHRANIENARFTEIGIATARGIYKGKDAIYVVQMFGRPAAPIVTSSTQKPVPSASSSLASVPPSLPQEKPRLADVPRATSSSAVKIPLPATSSPTRVAVNILAGFATTGPVSQVAGAADTITPPEPEIAPTPATPAVEAFSRPPAPSLGDRPLSLWEKIVASPRTAPTALFTMIGVLLAAALSATMVHRMRLHHPHLLVNGSVLLAIISGLIILNSTLPFVVGHIY